MSPSFSVTKMYITTPDSLSKSKKVKNRPGLLSRYFGAIKCPLQGGRFLGALFLGNYLTNQSEILHRYCLDPSEEHLLGFGPKYLEFRGKFRNLNFFGISRDFVVSVSLLVNINKYVLILLGITLKSHPN